MLYKDEAVVLRTMRLGEADRIVTFLGRAEGKIKAVAKGVRKTKSRFGGRLEPFSQVSLVLWRGKSGLDTVTQVSVVEPFRKIREDLNRFSLGEVMLEACDRVSQEAEQSARPFRLLIDSLHELTASDSPAVLAGYLLKLSAMAGFAPMLEQCAECGAAPIWFSPAAGGAVCSSCRNGDSARAGADLLHFMAGLARPRALGPGRIPEVLTDDPSLAPRALRLSRSYAEYHLERRLKAAAVADRVN
ncbi:MAG: DNA repair protein RecO [Actinomycetota bacterium]